MKDVTRRLFVHAGGGKTGSSALQSFFALNSDVLRENDIYYPDDGTNAYVAQGRISTGNSSRAALDLLHNQGGKIDSKNYQGFLAKLLDQLDASEHSNVLISSELWDSIPAFLLAKFVDLAQERGYEVTFIYYVRSLCDQLVSSWLQLVKIGVCLEDFHTFCLNASPNAFGFVLQRKFEEVSPEHPSRLLIKSYDYSRSRLCADFVETVFGIDPGTCRYHDKLINHSLGWPEADLVRSFNTLVDRSPPGEEFARRVMDATQDKHPGAPTIAPETLEVIEKRFGERVGAVNRYLTRTPISLLGSARLAPADKQDGDLISNPDSVARNRPAVLYFARCEDDPEAIGRFAASYRCQPAGLLHDLVVICPSDSQQSVEKASEAFAETPHRKIEIDDADEAFDAFQSVAKRLDHRWLFCFEPRSEILAGNWLDKLYGWGVVPGIGMAVADGAIGRTVPSSSGSPKDVSSLRMNAFLIDRERLLSVRGNGSVLFAKVIQEDLRVLVVDSAGQAHEANVWPASGKFGSGDPKKLLVADSGFKRYG